MIKKILIVFILTLAAAIFLAQRTLPGLMRKLAVKELNGILNTEAEIDDLDVTLWGGIISFSGVRIKNPPGFSEKYFLAVKHGYVDIGMLALLSKKINVEKIVLYEPKLNIEINNILNSNTPRVFKRAPAPRPGSGKRQKTKTYIRKVVIRDGIFKLTNYKVNLNGASALFEKVNITATPKSIDMQARLPAAGINGNVKLTAKGDFISDKISFDADLAAEDISLPYFMPFYINTAPVIVKSGQFDLRSLAKCRNNELYAVQKADIEGLELAANESSPGDNTIFGLPVLNVVNLFVNTNGRLTFEFEVTGTLADPKFHLGEALKEVLVKSIGQAILNHLSDIPGKILDKVEESGKIGEAGKEALQDILKKVFKKQG